MAYASRSGHAYTDAENPEAFGQCDRCGFWYNLKDLVIQYDWLGPQLGPLNLRVCTRTCYDKPFEHNRPIVTPPDPIPQPNPRPAQPDTGNVGFGMGAWSTGKWDQGQSPTQPGVIPQNDLAPPQGGTFDP